jgi:hypothetical protein
MESIPLLSPYETGRFRFSHRLDDLFYHSFSKLDSFIVLYFISLLSSVHQTFRASACKFLNSVMKMKVAFSLVYKIVSFNQLLICSLMFHEK